MIISTHRHRPTLRAILLLVTLFASASIASAQAGRLTNIEVVGLKRGPREQAIAASELRIGQAVDPGVLDAAATKLMQSGLFKKLTYRVPGRAGQIPATFELV